MDYRQILYTAMWRSSRWHLLCVIKLGKRECLTVWRFPWSELLFTYAEVTRLLSFRTSQSSPKLFSLSLKCVAFSGCPCLQTFGREHRQGHVQFHEWLTIRGRHQLSDMLRQGFSNEFESYKAIDHSMGRHIGNRLEGQV